MILIHAAKEKGGSGLRLEDSESEDAFVMRLAEHLALADWFAQKWQPRA